MELLRSFNGDVHTREAVKDFIDTFIAEEGVRLIFTRQDVTHIADAKELIDKAFEELNTLYGIKERPPEQDNHSR